MFVFCGMSTASAVKAVPFCPVVPFLLYLKFVAVAQVAGITETGDNILVLVHARVDGSAPDGGLVIGQGCLDVVYALGRGNDTADVDAAWRALGEECLVAQFHASARSAMIRVFSSMLGVARYST